MLENSEKKYHEITGFFLHVLMKINSGEDPSTPPKRVPQYCNFAKFESDTLNF